MSRTGSAIRLPTPIWLAAIGVFLLQAPAKPDDDQKFQGEYAGEVSYNGESIQLGVQVVARGDGRFDAIAYPGGLPGAGWLPPNMIVGSGTREGTGAAAVVKLEGVDWGGISRSAEIRDGKVAPLGDDGRPLAAFAKTERSSPTLGEKPPAGAIVIFDGDGPVDEQTRLVRPRITEDGLLMEGATTKDAFGDARLHIEFQVPYLPGNADQARGNSGVYLQGRYEIQVLDSFGSQPKSNGCGGIYRVAKPDITMSFPPLAWQTYDIDFRAPRFDAGRKLEPAQVTVLHNGVMIHDRVKLEGPTPGGLDAEEQPTGRLHLQDHGDPVRFRNIWVQPKS